MLTDGRKKMYQMRKTCLSGQSEIFHTASFRHVQRMPGENTKIKKLCEEKYNLKNGKRDES